MLFIHLFLTPRTHSSGDSTPSAASTATVTSGELRRALNLANAENVATNGSGSPVRSPKPSCSSASSKQIGHQPSAAGQKLIQIASVRLFFRFKAISTKIGSFKIESPNSIAVPNKLSIICTYSIFQLSPKAGCSSERDSPKPSSSSSQQQQMHTTRGNKIDLFLIIPAKDNSINLFFL